MAKERDRVEIWGQKFVMTERRCKGCPKVFKVTKKSKQKYHSRACEEFNGGKKIHYSYYQGTEESLLPKSGIIEPEED